MKIGEYTSYVNDMDIRAKVFSIEVVRLNKEHTHKTDESYLAKLAMGLIFRLHRAGRTDLITTVIQCLFESGYSLAGFKAKMYKYYLLSLAEKGYTPEDPMKSRQEAHLS